MIAFPQRRFTVRGQGVICCLLCVPIGLHRNTTTQQTTNTCVGSEVPPYHEDHRQDQACNGIQGAVLLVRVLPAENVSWRRKSVSSKT